ncbi:MAG: DNA gyrase inhibitor YacG [Steroidobacteraceae bacterium]|nr:DNA gyrase inhibitor YacG [Steroidobacteraceae bacterium]
MKVPCPTCERETEWSAASPYRPFCSERCRLIDLGAWLSEEHAIPGEPLDELPGAAEAVPPQRDPGSGA